LQRSLAFVQSVSDFLKYYRKTKDMAVVAITREELEEIDDDDNDELADGWGCGLCRRQGFEFCPLGFPWLQV